MAEPDITSVLHRWSAGDSGAIDELLPLVYEDLKRLARFTVRREREDHTLGATALVNEAYLRLVDQNRLNLENRAQFFYMAAQTMRRVLVDYARRHKSAKRGGSVPKVELDEAFMGPPSKQEEWTAVDEALEKFSLLDPGRARVVELRYFAGFTVEEIADLESRSLTAVKRDWAIARSWLQRALTESATPITLD